MIRVMCDRNVLLASLIQAELQVKCGVRWSGVEYRTNSSYKKHTKKITSFKGIIVEQDEGMIDFYVTVMKDKLILNIERAEYIYNIDSHAENLNTDEKIIITKNEDTIRYKKIYPEESHEIPLTSYKYVTEAISLARNIVELILKECD